MCGEFLFSWFSVDAELPMKLPKVVKPPAPVSVGTPEDNYINSGLDTSPAFTVFPGPVCQRFRICLEVVCAV
jgi:hypothetical protein